MFVTQRSILAQRRRRSAGGTHRLPAARGGISMVEILIGLAITAMLFTALTAAISAGIRSTQANVNYFNTIQTARVTLMKMASELRNCYAVDVKAATTTAPPEISIQVSSGTTDRVAYRWFHPDRTKPDHTTPDNTQYPKQLRRYTHQTDTDADAHRMASEVTNMTFAKQVTPSGVTNVTIIMTIAAGGDSITLCESVVPRRLMIAR